jgi:hypothetical protein
MISNEIKLTNAFLLSFNSLFLGLKIQNLRFIFQFCCCFFHPLNILLTHFVFVQTCDILRGIIEGGCQWEVSNELTNF